MNFLTKFRDFVASPSHSRTMGIVVMLILVSAVSLTVIAGQQKQTIKQHASASTSCSISVDWTNYTSSEELKYNQPYSVIVTDYYSPNRAIFSKSVGSATTAKISSEEVNFSSDYTRYYDVFVCDSQTDFANGPCLRVAFDIQPTCTTNYSTSTRLPLCADDGLTCSLDFTTKDGDNSVCSTPGDNPCLHPNNNSFGGAELVNITVKDQTEARKVICCRSKLYSNIGGMCALSKQGLPKDKVPACSNISGSSSAPVATATCVNAHGFYSGANGTFDCCGGLTKCSASGTCELSCDSSAPPPTSSIKPVSTYCNVAPDKSCTDELTGRHIVTCSNNKLINFACEDKLCVEKPVDCGTVKPESTCTTSASGSSSCSSASLTKPSCDKTKKCTEACNAQADSCNTNNGTRACTYTELTAGGECNPVAVPALLSDPCTIDKCISPNKCSTAGKCEAAAGKTATINITLNTQDKQPTSTTDIPVSLTFYYKNDLKNALFTATPTFTKTAKSTNNEFYASPTIDVSKLTSGNKYVIFAKWGKMLTRSSFDYTGQNPIPAATATLVFGDANGDGFIDTTDYKGEGFLGTCWLRKALPTGNCALSDFYGTGKPIDNTDFNAYSKGLLIWGKEGLAQNL